MGIKFIPRNSIMQRFDLLALTLNAFIKEYSQNMNLTLFCTLTYVRTVFFFHALFVSGHFFFSKQLI